MRDDYTKKEKERHDIWDYTVPTQIDLKLMLLVHNNDISNKNTKNCVTWRENILDEKRELITNQQ